MLRRTATPEKRGSSRVLDETIRLARRRGLIAASHDTAAVDSTGMETRHVSCHYARRSWRHRGHWKRAVPKLSAVCDVNSHVVLGGVADRGPKPDVVEFPELMRQALSRHRLRKVLADPGYESERAHVMCREHLGIESIIPTTVRGKKRKDGKPRAIRSRWRRRLKRWFPRKKYGQRWQIETVFSMVKRNLGSALKARKPWSLNREMLLKLIVHNLTILKRPSTVFSTEQDAAWKMFERSRLTRSWCFRGTRF